MVDNAGFLTHSFNNGSCWRDWKTAAWQRLRSIAKLFAVKDKQSEGRDRFGCCAVPMHKRHRRASRICHKKHTARDCVWFVPFFFRRLSMYCKTSVTCNLGQAIKWLCTLEVASSSISLMGASLEVTAKRDAMQCEFLFSSHPSVGFRVTSVTALLKPTEILSKFSCYRFTTRRDRCHYQFNSVFLSPTVRPQSLASGVDDVRIESFYPPGVLLSSSLTPCPFASTWRKINGV